MRKDTTEFRQRFLRWKNGEQVYDKGRVLPHYRAGLDEDDGTVPSDNTRVVNPRLLIAEKIVDLPTAADLLKAKHEAEQIGPTPNISQQERDLGRKKYETQLWVLLKKALELATDEMMMGIIDPRYAALGFGLGQIARAAGSVINAGKNLYKGYKVSRAIDKAVEKADFGKSLEIPGQVGWAPKTKFTGYHASNTAELVPNFWYPNWAVREHGAVPGFYIAEGDGPAGGFLSKRPYVHTIETQFDKPMVLVGEVSVQPGFKNVTRNAIELQARELGADGIIYQDIADNLLKHQTIAKTLNPDVDINVAGRLLNGQQVLTEMLPFIRRPYISPKSKIRGRGVQENNNGVIRAFQPDPEFVDKNGNVNIRNVVSLMLNFYKTHPDARNYKQILNSSGNLYLHIRDVVKSAQDIPVPQGYTRQQLVLAALFHDIGKVLNPDFSHGKTSVDMLNEMGIKLSPEVLDAVEHHMSNNMLDKSDLTRALHFADVARGDSWDVAAFKYPHLAYPFKKPNLNFWPMASVRDELKYKINPWLKARGYETIDLNLSEEDAWAELEDRIIQHRSFLRGARDPYKEYGSREDMRNAENAIKALMLETGMPLFLAESPEASALRTNVALTNVPLDPTGSGRSDLFDVRYNGPYPEHHKTYHSRMIGANPKTKDGLYISTSDDVGNNYATPSDDRYGDVGIVNLPVIPRLSGESMSEHLLKNDFDMVDLGSLSGQTTGIGSMYEGPYRLQTGRSLLSDMKKAGLIKPPFKRDYNSVLFPEDVDPRTGFNYSYALTLQQKTNDILRNFGIKFLFQPGSNGSIINLNGLRNAARNIDLVDRLTRELNFYSGPTSTYSDLINATQVDDSSILNELANDKIIPDDLLLILAEEEEFNRSAGIAPKPHMNIQKTNVKKERRNMNWWPSESMQQLLKSGKITKKQYEAVKKAYKYGEEDPSKYINPKKLIQKELDEYFASMKGKHFKAYTPDFRGFKLKPEDVAKFMREQGVVPRYEIEGYGDNIVYAIDAPTKNTTINKEVGKKGHRIYGYVLGNKGERVVDLNENVGYTHRVATPGTSRDSGARSSKKITRKSLRNLIPPILTAYTMYTNNDKR